MNTWPNRGGLRRPLRGAGIIEIRTAKREVRSCRSDSSQQASSKGGAVQFLAWLGAPRLHCAGIACGDRARARAIHCSETMLLALLT